MDNAVTKLCLGCGAPALPGKPRCQACLKEQAKLARKREAKRRQRALDAIEREAVDTLIEKATQGGSNIPHSAELTEQLMTYFGGVNGLASMFVKQYHEAPPGGSMRTRMLETITRLVTKNTEQGGAQKPVSLLSDDELQDMLEAQVQELAAEMLRRKTVDGKIEEAPSQPVLVSPGPSPHGSVGGVVSAPAADGVAGREGEPAIRVLEDVHADGSPGSVPSVPGP